MLRKDIDGLLVWLTPDDYAAERPALVLLDKGEPKGHADFYTICYVEASGNIFGARYHETLPDALRAFASYLPAR